MSDRPNGNLVFVVKLTGRAGHVFWLSPANKAGVRALANREWADVFEAYEDARLAIREMPRAFIDAGALFSVEPVD